MWDVFVATVVVGMEYTLSAPAVIAAAVTEDTTFANKSGSSSPRARSTEAAANHTGSSREVVEEDDGDIDEVKGVDEEGAEVG